jgi:thiamine-monophosphate kinase
MDRTQCQVFLFITFLEKCAGMTGVLMKTVGQVGEAALLAWLRETLGAPGAHVLCSVGDDAAVLRMGPSKALVSSTDTLVEGVDFLFDWASFADVGHKASAVNLSDLAAMGAKPTGLLLNLALREHDLVRDVKALIRACHALGQRYGAPLVGGDISSTQGPLVVSVTALGEGNPSKLFYRGRAKPGSDIWVSGPLGLAAGGLAALFAGQRKPQRIVKHQLRPIPRIELAGELAKTGYVRACADISDGLVRDVLHLPSAGAGVQLNVQSLEIDPALLRLAKALDQDALEWALAGGEDFELVFAASPRHKSQLEQFFAERGLKAQRVGKVVAGEGLKICGDHNYEGIKGFNHFG